jgi:hypothetical protein
MTDQVAPTASNPPAASVPKSRVRVFVDYWNFQLSLNTREAKIRGVDDFRFEIDWLKLGPWLAKKACAVIGCPATDHSFEGVNIYTSYDPASPGGPKFRSWAEGWLDRQPGVDVSCIARQKRGDLKCPSCHGAIVDCPHCKTRMRSTIEKGVDTLIATDMIRLAWENAYDFGVLATSDSDLVPAVKFLNLRGRKIVQAGFPPIGVDLATACWGSFDVFADRKEIVRPPKAT